jgi:hypothetical protein
MRIFVAAASAAVLATASPAIADTYTKANFSGGIFGGSANVKAPFAGNGFFGGQTFSGSFVYSNERVPGAGTGFVNVLPADFPEAALIPAATQFSFQFGSLLFTPAGAEQFAIQYRNGAFNGFVYVDNFDFQGGTYQLNIQGGTLSVYQVTNGVPGLNSLVNGYINIGNRALTGSTPFVPNTPINPVPEPATWAMMIAGFGSLSYMMRRRRPGVRIRYA